MSAALAAVTTGPKLATVDVVNVAPALNPAEASPLQREALRTIATNDRFWETDSDVGIVYGLKQQRSDWTQYYR